ncbi:MAG: MucR-family transcriptional regulator [Oxalobacteraceae bacterium]|nr:MAG: MucR-family transcriptional regulator [Oxalobacteraceae bacterium]
MSEVEANHDVASLTVQLLSAYLANNTVASDDLAGLIRSTKEALTGDPSADVQAEPETFTPAVSVRKSLASPEHIVSLIDGKPYKTLKRHLQSHGLTPDDYRSRYNLPASYPMVAPAYAERRREVAKQAGLGHRKTDTADAAAVNNADEVSSATAEPKTTDAAPAATETQQDHAPVAKKSSARSAKRATTDKAETAATQSSVPVAEAEASSDVGTAVESAKGEVPSPAKRQAKPAARKRTSASTQTDAPAGGHSKSKAKTERASNPAMELSTAPQDSTAEEQSAEPATKAKRRAKLGVFKKSDGEGSSAPNDGAEALPSAHETVADVAAAETPARRKSPKRMARGTEAKTD